MDWFTNFAGNIGYKADGSKAYASYFSVSVPFVLGGLDWTVEAGATPWENDSIQEEKIPVIRKI